MYLKELCERCLRMSTIGLSVKTLLLTPALLCEELDESWSMVSENFARRRGDFLRDPGDQAIQKGDMV